MTYPASVGGWTNRSHGTRIRDERLHNALGTKRLLGKIYEEVKLEWSMCLQPDAWQDSYDALTRDYKKLFDGESMGYASLDMRSYSLIGWIRHTNKSVIEYSRMHVEKREWHCKMLVNGHMEVFSSVDGLVSLSHLETKVAQIPGVIRTRVCASRRTTINDQPGFLPCLVIFVSLDMLPASRGEMLMLINAHVAAENLGFSLAARKRMNRYDLVEVDKSPAVSSSRFDVTRYDSLDFGKSTAFQRFRRQRKYKERKPLNVNTFWGRLRIVFQNRKEVKHWVKTGETPDVRS